jgi:hypothetical protein
VVVRIAAILRLLWVWGIQTQPWETNDRGDNAAEVRLVLEAPGGKSVLQGKVSSGGKSKFRCSGRKSVHDLCRIRVVCSMLCVVCSLGPSGGGGRSEPEDPGPPS